MWPWEPPLGILLSIGTGTSGSAGRPASTRRHFFWPLLDTLMKSMDGRASWLSFMNQTTPREQDALYRLDVQLQGPEPALDAADQMDNLIQQAITQGVGEDGRRCLLRLLTQSLFFELASAPDQECSGGLFRCVGSLRCRIPGRTFLAAMHRLDPSRKQFLLNGQRLRRDVVTGSTCPSCGRYCVPIRFSVRRLQDVVSLSIRFANGQQLSIGGFPQTIRWFMKQQGFSAVYGFSGRSQGLEACRPCARRLSARNLRLAQVKARRSVHIVTAVPVSGRMAEI